METTRQKRLFDAVERSYRALEPFRTMTRGLVEEYTGTGYGAKERKGKRETIVNLLHQAVDAYMMALAANQPRVLVMASKPELKPFARHFQVGINNMLTEIDIESTLRRWVMDAFFCVGIVKVHMASSGFVEIDRDLAADPGIPFASNVSLDNFVFDTSANKWTEVQYAGDLYRIPWDDLQDETIYNQDVAKDIKATSKSEAHDDDRLENIGLGYEMDRDEFMPMVDLIDLWIPRDGKIYTYPVHTRNGSITPYGEPVAEMEWTGPEFGPYKLLGFSDVPENVMPTSPASHLDALARIINNVYRKQARSARDFKEVTTYTGAGEKSARTFKRAEHGDLLNVNDTNEIGTLRSGGVDASQQQFMLGAMNDFDRMAGNLQALAGLGAQTDTAKQESLIHSSVSGRVAQMGMRVRKAVTSLVRDLAHLMWTDQFNIVQGQMPIDGLDGYSVDATWRPDDREGKFIDYDLQIDVYSMSYRSPAERAGQIMSIVGQVYAPMAQMLSAQGGTLDFQALNNTLAELYDVPQLREIIKFQAMPTQLPQGESEPGRPVGPTTREYVRRSVGASGRAGNIMQQQAWAQTQKPQANGGR